jgi:hypothetical protein
MAKFYSALPISFGGVEVSSRKHLARLPDDFHICLEFIGNVDTVATCVGLCHGQASADQVGVSASRNPATGEVTVTLDDRVSYPLLPSPDIDITMTIVLKQNGEITYTGNTTRFPRITVLERSDGGSWRQVYQSNPWARPFYYQTPLWLFGHTPTFVVTHRIVPATP